jgi:uncharacterized protein
MKFIETHEELRDLYGPVYDSAVKKELRRLDPHARNFIAKSPFLLIGSQDRNGNGDVTPKGDRPGFVLVLDDFTIGIPDRPGNKRLDTFENIIENPGVGLIFFIPGMDETLRMYGEARLTADGELRQRCAVDGKAALAVMLVKIRTHYMHCAKAFMRSQLWKPESWRPRAEMPTLGQIVRDQQALATSSEEIDAGLAEAYRKNLW